MRYSSENGRPALTSASTSRSTRSRSSGWITLAKLRTLLAMKSLAGKPEIVSISSLIHSIVQSASQAQR